MRNIIPLEPPSATTVDAAPLAWALSRMTPSLFAPALPGEALVDVRSRKAAAADILDDLLAEYAEELEESDRAGVWTLADDLLAAAAFELDGGDR